MSGDYGTIICPIWGTHPTVRSWEKKGIMTDSPTKTTYYRRGVPQRKQKRGDDKVYWTGKICSY